MSDHFYEYTFLPALPAELEDGLIVLLVEPPSQSVARVDLVTVRVLSVEVGAWEGDVADIWLPVDSSCSIRLTGGETPLYVVGQRSAVPGRLVAREYRLYRLRGYQHLGDGTVRFEL